MEKMGSVFVMVILAIFSYRGLGFGNLVHRYNYLYPGRIPASKNGKGSHPEDTMTHKPDHAVKAERPWNIKNKTILAICKISSFENSINTIVDVSSGQTALNTYDDGLYTEQTPAFNSDYVVSSEQTAANKYDDGLYPEQTSTAYMYDDGLNPERTTSFNYNHVLSSGQTAAYTYDDGLYSERTTTSSSGHVISSGQRAANKYDVGLYLERTTIFNSDHVVYSEQTAGNTYDDGLYPERTTTSNSDHGVYSVQTTANTYDDGLYPEWTTTSNSDHVISSGQRAANTYDDGLYPEWTTTSNSDHVISSGQRAANTYDDGLYPEWTTTSNSDHVVYSEQTAGNTYDDGLYPERTTTSNSNHGVYSGQTAAYTHDDGLYAERTTISNFNKGIFSKESPLYGYDQQVYPASSTRFKFDQPGVYIRRTKPYKYANPKKISTSKYGNNLNPERVVTSNLYHGVYQQGATSSYNGNGVNAIRTTASKYNHDVYPDGTTTTSKYDRDVYQDGTTTASKYDYDVYPAVTTTVSKYDHDVYPDGTTTASKYDHDVYPDGTTTASKYDHGVYPDGATTASKYDHDVYPDGTTTTSKYDHDVYPDGTTTASKYDHDVYPDGTTTASKYNHDVYADGTTTYIYDYEATEDIHPQGQNGQSRQTTTNKYALGIHLTRNKRFMAGYGVYPEQTTTSIFDNSVLPELTTRYKYDHSLYHKGTRTSKYVYGVYPEGTTEHLYDNGVTTEPGISVYIEEKTVIGGQMTCDIINITNTVSPSAWGAVYHVEKSSRMFWVWFYDLGYISVTLSNSCTNLMPEPFTYFRERDLQRLQDCENGTVIQKLLCNPSVTYNISLVNDVIPYFSDLGIFFADGINNCTELFNKFIESKKSILSNAHVNYFLTNRSNCSKYAFFTNQITITVQLNEIRNGSGNIISGYIYTDRFFQKRIGFIMKRKSCRELFHQYVYRNVKTFGDKAFISVGNINIFSNESNCLDVRFPCPETLHEIERYLPASTTFYVQMVMSVEVTLVNSIFLFIFLQKENRTPVTILLSLLAVSDTTTVLLMTLPLFISYERSSVLFLEFPECVIYRFSFELVYVFHLTSVLITTLLCLQKTVALLFPMWSKRSINSRVSFIFSFFAFFISVCINSPKLVENLLSIKNVNGRCCTILSDDAFKYHYSISNACYLASCLVVTICTIYIICKLTCLRRNLPWIDSPAVQKRNRMSAITVMIICIIFLLSESALIVQNFTFMLYYFDSSYLMTLLEIYFALIPYSDINIIFGFSLNFIVYIVMSKQLRDTLVIRVIRIVRCCKYW